MAVIIKISDAHNLILNGSSGSGKTRQAKALSAFSGRPVFDIDAEIVKSEGMEINEIFGPDKAGEPRFRGLETGSLRTAVLLKGWIIVPGAGAVCRPENRALMRSGGFCLWIDPSLRILQKRLAAKTDRPNAQSPEAIAERFWARRTFYGDVAHACISFDAELPVEEVTERILHKLGWK